MEKTDVGTWSLKRNSNYYFQVQGNLNIVHKGKCYFIVYSQYWIEVEEIFVDNELWVQTMLPKLER